MQRNVNGCTDQLRACNEMTVSPAACLLWEKALVASETLPDYCLTEMQSPLPNNKGNIARQQALGLCAIAATYGFLFDLPCHTNTGVHPPCAFWVPQSSLQQILRHL